MTILYAKCSDIYMNEPYLIIATLNIEVKKKIKLYTSCNKYVTKVIFLDLKNSIYNIPSTSLGFPLIPHAV